MECYAGDLFYNFPQLDFYFEPLPGSIPSGNGSWKWQLSMDSYDSDVREWLRTTRTRGGMV